MTIHRLLKTAVDPAVPARLGIALPIAAIGGLVWLHRLTRQDPR